MNLNTSLLLTDLYELNMLEVYLDDNCTETAVFEFFVRQMPFRRTFPMATGLKQVLSFLEQARFSEDEMAWLTNTGRFNDKALHYFTSFRFTGDVHAMLEGRIFFPNEPILYVTAPMPQAQLIETRIINLLHFQTVVASKTARVVLADQDKLLVDFGLRSSHGGEAGLLAARVNYIAGFADSTRYLPRRNSGYLPIGP